MRQIDASQPQLLQSVRTRDSGVLEPAAKRETGNMQSSFVSASARDRLSSHRQQSALHQENLTKWLDRKQKKLNIEIKALIKS